VKASPPWRSPRSSRRPPADPPLHPVARGGRAGRHGVPRARHVALAPAPCAPLTARRRRSGSSSSPTSSRSNGAPPATPSPRTVATCTTSSSFSPTTGPGRPSAPPRPQLRDFIFHLKDLGLAATSIRRHVSAVRTYYRFLVGEGHVARDPTERLASPKKWRTLPAVLSVAEVERLLAAPHTDDPLAWRDRALLEFAYATGARVSEMVGIGTADVLYDEGLARLFGKGSKERLVPVGRRALGASRCTCGRPAPDRERRGARPPVPQRPGHAAVAGRGMGHHQAVRAGGGPDQAGDAAHPAAYIRHAPDRRGCRPSGGSGDVGARGPEHDAALHARGPGVSPKCASDVPPAGLSAWARGPAANRA